ncbi:MAG: hypothetical protein IPM29_06375 [Planctomycetes bacterium]|nr:hypothetical protein [Planctomycetota bacterium]
MRTHFLATLAALAGSATLLPAQLAVTSPLGYDNIEGNTTFNHFDSGGDRRFQQIDATHLNRQFIIRSLGFRRDGGTNGGGTNEPPRTMDLEITFGLANMTILTSAFDPNFLPGSSQVSFIKRQVNMPDWTGNAGTPGPYDFVIPLDFAFPYAGNDALVIDFTYENLVWQGTATGGSAVDRQYVGATTATGTALGTGCTASTSSSAFSHSMRLENNGLGGAAYGMRMRIDATNAPISTPVLLNIDLADLNLTVPGLCATVHAGPTLSLPIAVSDPLGAVGQTSLSWGYNPVFVGVQLVTQLAAFDAGQPAIPVVLSQGRVATMPNDPSSLAENCVYHWASGTSQSGTLFYGGGMVMQLGL